MTPFSDHRRCSSSDGQSALSISKCRCSWERERRWWHRQKWWQHNLENKNLSGNYNEQGKTACKHQWPYKVFSVTLIWISAAFQKASQRWGCLPRKLGWSHRQPMPHSPLLNLHKVLLCHPQLNFIGHSASYRTAGLIQSLDIISACIFCSAVIRPFLAGRFGAKSYYQSFFIFFQFLQTFKSRTMARVQQHWRWRYSGQIKKPSSMWRLEYLLFGWRWEQPHLKNFQCLFDIILQLTLASIHGWIQLPLMNTTFALQHFYVAFVMDMHISFTKADQTRKHFNDCTFISFTIKSKLTVQILSYIQMYLLSSDLNILE